MGRERKRFDELQPGDTVRLDYQPPGLGRVIEVGQGDNGLAWFGVDFTIGGEPDSTIEVWTNDDQTRTAGNGP